MKKDRITKYNCTNRILSHIQILGVDKTVDSKRTFVKCKCLNCGREFTLLLPTLIRDYNKAKQNISCGCVPYTKVVGPDVKTRLYGIWNLMISRCENSKIRIYKKYGAKGIRVCEEWKSCYKTFKEWADKNNYQDFIILNDKKEPLTIDRINSDGNYCPENCKWSTYTEQNNHLKFLKNNSSGYKGISYSRFEKKWLVVISINNKTVRIGSYLTQKEAVEARNNYIINNNLTNSHELIEYVGELVKLEDLMDKKHSVSTCNLDMQWELLKAKYRRFKKNNKEYYEKYKKEGKLFTTAIEFKNWAKENNFVIGLFLSKKDKDVNKTYTIDNCEWIKKN